jgi:UDP-glucose 4-epimerase
MIVAVTGAAGYIGGQIVLQLLDAGHTVLGIDRKALSFRSVDLGRARFVKADFSSDTAFKAMLMDQPEVIIHCAGTSLVGPSINNPDDYYQNNFVRTKKLLDFVRRAMPRTRVIFSSSAAVYGEPIMTPCHEVDPCEPISPYGESKRMVEQMLQSYNRAYGLDYVAFRYFNACGADPQARHGQEPGATHIIARVLESVVNEKQFVLNGNDYATADGTCVRDYVHVEDIARAHLEALDSKVPCGIYNLGSKTGISNKEIIAAVERIAGRAVNMQLGQRRSGDPAILTASSDKFDALVSWRQYQLDDIIDHAWAWYNA